MRIGDPIVQQVVSAVNIIERQFNAVELIDTYDSSSGDVYELLTLVAKFLRSISDCRIVYLYMAIRSRIDANFSHPHAESGPAPDLPESLLPSDRRTVRVTSDRSRKHTLLVAAVRSKYLPTTYLVLKDEYFGRKTSRLHDPYFSEYVAYVTAKLAAKIDEASQSRLLENYRRLSDNFLGDPGRPTAGSDGDTGRSAGVPNPWASILNSVFDYLPVWGPFSFGSEKPRIQVLSVQKGRQFLTLRAESETDPTTGSWRITPRELQLRRTRTVCGLYLDLEERSEAREYLIVNPKEHRDRYAAMLFSEKDLPESELMIPVKDRDGKTVAIFNFEHPIQHAFLLHHVEMLCKMAADVGPFVKSILAELDRNIDKEKDLRYLMLRIATRLSDTQIHKTRNDFALLISALSEAKRAIKQSNLDAAVSEIEAAEQKIKDVKNVSLDFATHIKDYVKFGKRSLRSILNDVIPDTQKRASYSGDNVSFQLNIIPERAEVFCSGLAREQVHNVIQNSIEQFVERRRDDPSFSGLIEIGFQEIVNRQAEKNIDTYNFFEVFIADNGGGAPSEVEAHVLEPGFSWKKGGTGFGLTSARDYMERIGGHLIFENRRRVGVTVRLQFPEYVESLHEAMAEQLNITQ